MTFNFALFFNIRVLPYLNTSKNIIIISLTNKIEFYNPHTNTISNESYKNKCIFTLIIDFLQLLFTIN